MTNRPVIEGLKLPLGVNSFQALRAKEELIFKYTHVDNTMFVYYLFEQQFWRNLMIMET